MPKEGLVHRDLHDGNVMVEFNVEPVDPKQFHDKFHNCLTGFKTNHCYLPTSMADNLAIEDCPTRRMGLPQSSTKTLEDVADNCRV